MNKDQVMRDFERAIALAGKDNHDIVSAYEEIIEEFKEKYPQYAADFDEPFKDEVGGMFIDDEEWEKENGR